MNLEATKVYSSKQENLIAYSLGWDVVSGSGAAACWPGDVISQEWLGECKTHTSSGKNILFSLDVWNKINEEAMVKQRKPVLFVDDGSQKLSNTWVCVNELNFNLSSLLIIDSELKIRKNITFNSSKKLDHIEKVKKVALGDWAFDGCFKIKWDKYNVLVMPFEVFKEHYNK